MEKSKEEFTKLEITEPKKLKCGYQITISGYMIYSKSNVNNISDVLTE